MLWAADDGAELPTLRLINYRGPGNLDRELAPAICDGDSTTEWVATGLAKTTLGPPFEFEFEFLDGAAHELAGVKLLSAAATPGWQAKDFEIRLQMAGREDYQKVIYRGSQQVGGAPQTHLFEAPVVVRRFMFKLLSNQGNPDNAEINEFAAVFNAGETAGARAANEAEASALPLVQPKPPAAKHVGKFPFTELVQVKPPVVQGAQEVVNDIDRFVLSKLEAKGLGFAARVDRDLLLRRVTYDLTGLPPTSQEREEFLADKDADAYEKVVDRLLNSPRFGEHWAQFWLDLVRYADTDGYALNGARPGVWRFRDYVINAFNNDKPYNQFVVEQLAADEMKDAPLETLPALAFCRLGPFRANSGNQNLDRNRQEFMTEVTGTVSTTFLGLTVGCARCHDHKIDPIPQDDYYRLQAFFDAAEPATLLMAPAAEQRQWRDKSLRIQKVIGDLEEQRQTLMRPAREVLKTKLTTMPTDKEVQAAMGKEERAKLAALTREQTAARASLPPALPPAWGIKDSGPVAPASFALLRGEVTLKDHRVAPRVPGILPHADASENIEPVPGRTTGRRLSLAKWLVGPGQSQTARVMVNRLWQQHFGRGIVATSSNFGGLGQAPTHPELLDWLAQNLIEGGWKMKHLHRLMVLSRTYQQASSTSPEAFAKDETNALFSRFIRHRLSAEEIRDSVLFHAGTLNLKEGGEGVVVPQPEEALVETKKGSWRVTKDQTEHTRRSIYLFVERKYRIPLMESFDQPDTMTACPERSRSTHVLQTLGLLNNQWLIEQAALVAERLQSSSVGNNDPLAHAYKLICGREPTAKEMLIARQYVAQESLTAYCHVLFNLNRFLYVD
ncbi:MAG: hypothetical protein JWO94_1362 [Verrucomicrobiaceae bacterium]|nr:hypothetical protein [Verrucomicrobiaceae bacterium]